MPLRENKFKILLIQLPAPTFKSLKHWGNVPLAAGYLKAMACKEQLLNELEIEILDQKNTNLSSDSRLIDLIISKAPDALGFSLYLWNSLRSLFIIQEIKKKNPKIKIIVGGPEVTSETGYVLNDPAIDIGCIGEGEITFIEIMQSILKGEKDYAGINGIFFKKSGKVVITGPRAPIDDLNQIPSPFKLGFINPVDYHQISYETIRGCLFKCSYCVNGLIPMKYFSVERICEDLRIIMAGGSKKIRLIDSDFTMHPNFYEICKRIKELNREKKLSFGISVYGGNLSREHIESMKEGNIVELEIGLQSIRPQTLRNIQRPSVDIGKLKTGLEILEKNKIDYSVDIIIGLPGDTIADLRKTFAIFKKEKIKKVSPFVLAVMPGTILKQEAKKYGIVSQNKPPYLLISSRYISLSKIKEGLSLFQGESTLGFAEAFINSCSFPHLGLHPKTRPIYYFQLAKSNIVMQKIIIAIGQSSRARNCLGEISKKLSRMIHQPITLWFKCGDFGDEHSLIKSFLFPLTQANPFLIWKVILEVDQVYSLRKIKSLLKAISSKEKILVDVCNISAAAKVCFLFPYGNNCDEKLLNNLSGFVPFFWTLDLSIGQNWQSKLKNLMQEKFNSGIVIDFDLNSGIDFIIEVLKYIRKADKMIKKRIFFRNLAIYYLIWLLEQKERASKAVIIRPRLNDLETILSFEKNMQPSLVLSPQGETIMDLVEYQINLLKIL